MNPVLGGVVVCFSLEKENRFIPEIRCSISPLHLNLPAVSGQDLSPVSDQRPVTENRSSSNPPHLQLEYAEYKQTHRIPKA